MTWWETSDNHLDAIESRKISPQIPKDISDRTQALRAIRESSSNGEIRTIKGAFWLPPKTPSATTNQEWITRLNNTTPLRASTLVEKKDNQGQIEHVEAVKREAPKDAIANGSHPAEAQQAAAETRNTPSTADTTSAPEVPSRIRIVGEQARPNVISLGWAAPTPTQQDVANSTRPRVGDNPENPGVRLVPNTTQNNSWTMPTIKKIGL